MHKLPWFTELLLQCVDIIVSKAASKYKELALNSFYRSDDRSNYAVLHYSHWRLAVSCKSKAKVSVCRRLYINWEHTKGEKDIWVKGKQKSMMATDSKHFQDLTISSDLQMPKYRPTAVWRSSLHAFWHLFVFFFAVAAHRFLINWSQACVNFATGFAETKCSFLQRSSKWINCGVLFKNVYAVFFILALLTYCLSSDVNHGNGIKWWKIGLYNIV